MYDFFIRLPKMMLAMMIIIIIQCSSQLFFLGGGTLLHQIVLSLYHVRHNRTWCIIGPPMCCQRRYRTLGTWSPSYLHSYCRKVDTLWRNPYFSWAELFMKESCSLCWPWRKCRCTMFLNEMFQLKYGPKRSGLECFHCNCICNLCFRVHMFLCILLMSSAVLV